MLAPPSHTLRDIHGRLAQHRAFSARTCIGGGSPCNRHAAQLLTGAAVRCDLDAPTCPECPSLLRPDYAREAPFISCPTGRRPGGRCGGSRDAPVVEVPGGSPPRLTGRGDRTVNGGRPAGAADTRPVTGRRCAGRRQPRATRPDHRLPVRIRTGRHAGRVRTYGSERRSRPGEPERPARVPVRMRTPGEGVQARIRTTRHAGRVRTYGSERRAGGSGQSPAGAPVGGPTPSRVNRTVRRSTEASVSRTRTCVPSGSA